jgi:hypothetical protein
VVLKRWVEALEDALKNIGQVDKLDKLGNVVQGETVFNPFRYGAGLGKTYLENQKQGYGGIFKNVGGSDTFGGQAFNAVTSSGNPAGGIMNAVGGPQGQMIMASGQQPAGGGDITSWLSSNFDTSDRTMINGQVAIRSKDGNYYTQEQAKQMYHQQSQPQNQPQQQGQSILDFLSRKLLPQSIEDSLQGSDGTINLGNPISYLSRKLLPQSVEDAFQGNNSDGGMFGGNMGAAGLAALYGKVVYDATKEREGGLAETPKVTMDQLGRYEMAKNLGTGGSRADFGLAPAPVALDFNMGGPVYGYNYGGPVRQYFNKGGIALIQELDMRDGGESDGPGTGTSDDIPAMLSDGEFVMTAKATKGAGAFGVNKTKSGIELVKGGSPSRKKGVENMRELMNIFEAI